MAIKTSSSVQVNVRARPCGVWTAFDDLFDEGALLVIRASNDQTWAYADATKARCGPDGDAQALLSRDKCIMPSAPVGALIGKIGGSTAGDTVGTMFVVGSFCVFRVPAGGGPLFLTINDESGGLENNSGTLTVTVGVADRPQPVPAPVPPAGRCIPVSLCIPAGSLGAGADTPTSKGEPQTESPSAETSEPQTPPVEQSDGGKTDGEKSDGQNSDGEKSDEQKAGEEQPGDKQSGEDEPAADEPEAAQR